MNEIIAEKSKATHREKKQELAIKRTANDLMQELIRNKKMDPHEKMNTISSVQEQV